jgi:transposase
MNPEPNHSASEKAVREIKRRTRRKFSTEEKIRIVLEGLRGEMSISELCRPESIHPNLYYNWSKEFLEAGKKRLLGDTVREANSGEVKALRRENEQLKQALAEELLQNRYLKKSCLQQGIQLDDI